MRKLEFNEGVAIVVGLLFVGGFFLFLNPSTAVQISDSSEVVGGEAAVISGLQEVIQGTNVTELIIKDITLGTGSEAVSGDRLSVHYIGVLTDGAQFDSSVDRGIPFEFILGEGQVIRGWDEGLVGMKEGGRRVLVIPPELGYGEAAVGSIPPNSVLIFEVLLVEILTEI